MLQQKIRFEIYPIQSQRVLMQSKKVGGLAGFRQYSDYGGVSCPPLFPSTDRNGKCQTLIWIFHHYYGRQAHFGQTSPSLTTTRERGVLPKMGAKNATDFQKSVVLLFGAVFNFSLPFPLLGKRKGQPILAVL